MKKALTIVLSILMLLSVCPVAFATESVSYVNRKWDNTTKTVVSETKTVTDYTVVTDSTTAMEDGWYVVNSNVTVADPITVTGTVHLILSDGYTLTANKGIVLKVENSLTIYGQANDTGAISATGQSYYAGIGAYALLGCGTLAICGGKVTAEGGIYGAGIGCGYQGSGGNISIYGGEVTANSDMYGAGIGGGYQGAAGNISIYGGTVNATADTGAGIGGGDNESYNEIYEGTTGKIAIYGGKVDARSSDYGAGIGGGDHGTVTSVTISGGTVNATGGRNGAGIGGGYFGDGTVVNISGGTVTAAGGMNAAGIGGGYGGDGISVTITGGSVHAIEGFSAVKIGKGYNGSSSGTLTNGASDVSETVLTLSDAANVNIASMEGLSGYGIKDVKTDSTGKLYFYLPANTTLPTKLTADDGNFYSANGSAGYVKHAHTYEDDGNCTTPVICTTCSATVIEAKAAHTDGEAVVENETTATCTADGKYDTVVYCAVCNTELSRETTTVPAQGHGKTEIRDDVKATVEKEGYTGDTYCTVCDKKIADGKVIPKLEAPSTPDEPTEGCDHMCHKDGIMGFFWKIINFFQRLFGSAQYCECGAQHYEKPLFAF